VARCSSATWVQTRSRTHQMRRVRWAVRWAAQQADEAKRHCRRRRAHMRRRTQVRSCAPPTRSALGRAGHATAHERRAALVGADAAGRSWRARASVHRQRLARAPPVATPLESAPRSRSPVCARRQLCQDAGRTENRSDACWRRKRSRWSAHTTPLDARVVGFPNALRTRTHEATAHVSGVGVQLCVRVLCVCVCVYASV
jgi:hypothetical protein